MIRHTMSHSTTPFVVIQMTPPGRGAVATLRIEGPGAVDAVAAVFRRSRRATVGRVSSKSNHRRSDRRRATERRARRWSSAGAAAMRSTCTATAGLAAVAAVAEPLGRPAAGRSLARVGRRASRATHRRRGHRRVRPQASPPADGRHPAGSISGACVGRSPKSSRPATRATPAGPNRKSNCCFPGQVSGSTSAGLGAWCWPGTPMWARAA